MKTTCDDCWPPRSGSWEEAVEPYEIQRRRLGTLLMAKLDTPSDDPVTIPLEPKPAQQVTATV